MLRSSGADLPPCDASLQWTGRVPAPAMMPNGSQAFDIAALSQPAYVDHNAPTGISRPGSSQAFPGQNGSQQQYQQGGGRPLGQMQNGGPPSGDPSYASSQGAGWPGGPPPQQQQQYAGGSSEILQSQLAAQQAAMQSQRFQQPGQQPQQGPSGGFPQQQRASCPLALDMEWIRPCPLLWIKSLTAVCCSCLQNTPNNRRTASRNRARPTRPPNLPRTRCRGIKTGPRSSPVSLPKSSARFLRTSRPRCASSSRARRCSSSRRS